MPSHRDGPGGRTGAEVDQLGAGRQQQDTGRQRQGREQPFQVMPPLTDDEYQALKDDIAEHGVLVPVVKDQHGRIIDGHHRVEIAGDLGINYPVETIETASDDDARHHARVLNLARRHLTRRQKRELIGAEIEADPDRSDRAIGRLLGVDHKTVGSVRRELAGEIPHSEQSPEQEDAVGVTEALRLVLVQYHDAITEAWTNGLPASFILETTTESLVTSCPEEVREAAQKMLQPIIAELAVAAATEREKVRG